MKNCCAYLLLLLVSLPLIAESGVEVSFGPVFIGNEVEESGPGPINTSAGAGYYHEIIDGFLFLRGSLAFWGQDYAYLEDRGAPVEIEYKDAVWLGTLMIDPHVGFYLLPGKIKPFVTGHAAFMIRIPLGTSGSGGDMRDDLQKYFMSDGRFFYPGLGTGILYKLDQRWEVLGAGAVYSSLTLPRETVGFDNVILRITFGIRYLL